MNNTNYMEREKQRIEKEITSIQNELATLPQGRIEIHKSGKKFSWYSKMEGNKKRKYIPKSEKKYAEELARRGLLMARLRDCRENQKAVDLYLKYSSKNERAANYLNRSQGMKDLIGYDASDYDKTVGDWLLNNTPRKEHDPDGRIFPTEAGYKVRSKSEQIIASHFKRRGIPHIYEKEIVINGWLYYPDFTIMNPQTHRVYIWEHLGSMDNKKYRDRNLKKIEDYATISVIAGDNLILTMESNNSGIDDALIEYYIDRYLV